MTQDKNVIPCAVILEFDGRIPLKRDEKQTALKDFIPFQNELSDYMNILSSGKLINAHKQVSGAGLSQHSFKAAAEHLDTIKEDVERLGATFERFEPA